MLLTIFLAIVFCAAITLMLVSAVVLVKDKKLFSSAPKEALELVIDRKDAASGRDRFLSEWDQGSKAG